MGHFRRIPGAAIDELMEAKLKDPKDSHLIIPPLLTFERLVSFSLVNFLLKR
jgi:hypothetical protein